MEIDLHVGTVNIRGPATKQEQAAWARWDIARILLEEELGELKALLHNRQCRGRRAIRTEIQKTETVLTIIRYALAGSRPAMHLLEGIELPDEVRDELERLNKPQQ